MPFNSLGGMEEAEFSLHHAMMYVTLMSQSVFLCFNFLVIRYGIWNK